MRPRDRAVLDRAGMSANPRWMTPRMPRRSALKLLAAGAAAPVLGLAAESKPAGSKWKTAVGLNGFQSLKLLKDGGFRGWIMVDESEVPDPYDACLKCKRAIDQAWET